MVVAVALIFVGATHALQALGLEYAFEDCFAAAAVATIITAMRPPS
jgi:hypothetical protein